MTEFEQGSHAGRGSMAEQQAREAGRYIAQFVPENNIKTATSIPGSLIRAHVASEHIGRMQGGGTSSLEPYSAGQYSGSDEVERKRKMIEDFGEMGAGNLDVLAYRLDQVERGAGDYASSFAHRLTTRPDISPSRIGTIQKELEDEALRTLHSRAGSNVGALRARMTEEAKEFRHETHEKIGNPYDKYEIDSRVERIRQINDSRLPLITGSEVYKILQDLKSGGQFRLATGYSHVVDLFTGTLKGAQERMYLNSRFGELHRSEV